MKKVLILIFIMFFSQNTIYAEDELIWDYKNDQFVKELIQGQNSASEVEKQRRLDEELSKNLGINLIYTNLSECVKVAIDNNYNIKSRNSIKKQHYWEYKNANTQFLPNVSYLYTMQYIDGKFLVGGVLLDKFDELPIQNIFQAEWLGTKQGKVFFTNARTKNTLKASTSTLEYTRDEVILQTALIYYDLLSQKLQFDVFKSDVIDRTQQYKLVKARYDAGLDSRYYVDRAEASVANAQQLYIAAFNKLRLTQAKLANVMGIEILDAIYPTETSIETKELIESTYTIDTLYDMALVTRDDLKAAKLHIEALKAERSSNYLDFAPNTYASYQRGLVGTPDSGFGPNSIITLNVTFPLGENLGLGTFTKIKAYNERIESEKYKLTIMMRNAKESILGSYYDSKTALERIEAAKKEVKAADSSVKQSTMRYKVGAGVFSDVIAAQSVKILARQTLIRAVTDYNQAQVQLLFNSGILSINSVLNGYCSKTKNAPP